MSVYKSIGEKLDGFIAQMLGSDKLFRLAAEFLDVPYQSGDEQLRLIDEQPYGLTMFNAWLRHDYLHKGKSMLEHFRDSGPKLTSDEKRELGQMIQTSIMSGFRIGEVRPGNIELEDLRSGTRYHVREYAMASQVLPGQFIIARLCQQGDHWEIIMPDGSMFPFTFDDEALLQAAVDELPERMTMQYTTGYAFLQRDLGLDKSDEPAMNVPGPKVSKKEAALRLEQAMADTSVDRYISPATIMRLLDEEFTAKETPPFPATGVRVLLGLADSTERLELLMSAAMTYWNAHVSKRTLKKPRVPDVVVHEFDPSGWLEKAGEAHDLLMAQKPIEASYVYEDLFAHMLKEHLVTPSLYRLVTNAAVAELGQGHLLYGEKLLETAQDLCPDYDLARRQRDMLEDGHYDMLGLAGGAENGVEDLLEKMKQMRERLGPSPETLKGYTDKQLLQTFSERGVTIDKKTFIQSAARYDKAYDMADELTGNDPNHVDAVFSLLCEARNRWTPDVVWVDTLHMLADTYDESMFDADGHESTDYAAMQHTLNQLLHVLQHASDTVVQQWMTDSNEYAGHRQNIVFASLQIARAKPKQTRLLQAATALCELAHERTSDPIFTVPGLLESVPSATENDVKKQLAALAKVLPNDFVSFQILGDQLEGEKHYELAVAAREHAIAALDRRRSKQLWQDSPYSYETLAESYNYIGEGLRKCYTALGRDSDVKKLDKKLDALETDTRLEHNPSADGLEKLHDEMVEKEAGAGNPILTYLRWFDTLDIDLSGGDGNETVITARQNGKKIGRNDPCPCGKLRPNGLPMKYKNCCGA